MRNRIAKLTIIFCTVILITNISPHAFGQGSTPQRGFHPGGSYVMSDIETINTNLFQGNLMLNLPLAKLPPGRNGLTAGIYLRYDSKLYDSHVEYYDDYEYGNPPDPVRVERNVLFPSEGGGWRYGMAYELQLIDRVAQYYATRKIGRLFWSMPRLTMSFTTSALAVRIWPMKFIGSFFKSEENNTARSKR